MDFSGLLKYRRPLLPLDVLCKQSIAYCHICLHRKTVNATFEWSKLYTTMQLPSSDNCDWKTQPGPFKKRSANLWMSVTYQIGWQSKSSIFLDVRVRMSASGYERLSCIWEIDRLNEDEHPPNTFLLAYSARHLLSRLILFDKHSYRLRGKTHVAITAPKPTVNRGWPSG